MYLAPSKNLSDTHLFVTCFHLLFYSIQTDHNEDRTEQRLKEWTKHAKLMYKDVKISSNSSEKRYVDAKGPNDWSASRYSKVAILRQNALDLARALGSDYLLVRSKHV